MAATRPRYSKEEFARRGDAVFERSIRPAIGAAKEGDFVAIDIESGAYEVDADEQAASDRLLARLPDAQIWLRRVGSRYARRFGGRGKPAAP
jgi:dihydroxyacid dehydratase/phosphogluconate dehydratase